MHVTAVIAVLEVQASLNSCLVQFNDFSCSIQLSQICNHGEITMAEHLSTSCKHSAIKQSNSLLKCFSDSLHPFCNSLHCACLSLQKLLPSWLFFFLSRNSLSDSRMHHTSYVQSGLKSILTFNWTVCVHRLCVQLLPTCLPTDPNVATSPPCCVLNTTFLQLLVSTKPKTHTSDYIYIDILCYQPFLSKMTSIVNIIFLQFKETPV